MQFVKENATILTMYHDDFGNLLYCEEVAELFKAMHFFGFNQARGSPDGGAPPEEGVSSSASEGSETTDAVEATESAEPGRVELPAERLLHARAGWLQRRGPGGVWSRHWFVLRGAALLYFRDPHAEHRGLMDGVIDLSGISRVVDLPAVNSTNGYAFETEVSNDSKNATSIFSTLVKSSVPTTICFFCLSDKMILMVLYLYRLGMAST